MKRNGLAFLCAAILMLSAGCGNETSSESLNDGMDSTISQSEETHANTTSLNTLASDKKTAASVSTSTEESESDVQPVQTEEGQTSAVDIPMISSTEEQIPPQTTDVTPNPDGMKIWLETVKAKPGEEKVPVQIRVENNTGFTILGLQIYYPKGLSPYYSRETNIARFDRGDDFGDMFSTCVVNESEKVVALVSMNLSGEDFTEDGVIGTVYFDVAKDVKVDSVCILELNVDSLVNSEKKSLPSNVVRGELHIQ